MESRKFRQGAGEGEDGRRNIVNQFEQDFGWPHKISRSAGGEFSISKLVVLT